MSPYNKLLSTDQCKNILSKDLNHQNFTIKSFEISSLSDKIEGFLGEHFVVIIEYDLLEEPFCHCKTRYFMKMLSGASQVITQITTALNAFAKEEFFYNFLLVEMNKNHIDVSFAPKSYICKSNIVVLEDLSMKEYRNFPKTSFFDVAHCKQALNTLAKLHSSSILYERQLGKDSNLLYLYPEMFKNVFSSKDSNNIVQKWFKHSLEGLFPIIEHIYEKDARKNDFISKLNELVKNSHDILDNASKHGCAILHGDVWSNNFLFKYKEETLTDCVLIDYQMVNYGPPSMEVLHLLYCNTRKEFRDDHLSEFIDFYYDRLQANLSSESDLNSFLPKDEFLRLCEVYKPWIKLQCICDKCVTFIPDKYVNVTNDDDLRKYLFEDRAKVILTCFENEKSFREVLSEDIEELRELVLKDLSLKSNLA
ncbi:hypothetical protein ILUMI_25228 [Ignelater luminosus]|uniref:CHK kinase-like domain-containing protein n=1 Tax=Ignelater luminosus TaxID=2038154 RepID=A0A8K0FY25_IGNLU|nr:hypothetical protein ILUMI_25228 [Ignelater luminosus]